MQALLDAYDRDRLTSLTPDRRRSSLAVLRHFAASLDATDAKPSAADLHGFLAQCAAAGRRPGTLRKDRAVVLAFFRWAWEAGYVSGDDLLALRAVRLPGVEWAGSARPQPYSAGELRALVARLDERWPRMAPDEARHWLARWAEGRSPYSRVRSHAIRCQLDAVIALALRCGLRRREVFALDLDAMHPDNAYVVVWEDGIVGSTNVRTVPYTANARDAVSDWLGVRRVIGPTHERPWLSLWSAESANEPMRRETFDKLLRTYVGEGYTLRRLRDTCAVSWVRASLPLEDLRVMLGLSSLDATLPYVRLVGGNVGRAVERHEPAFSHAIDGDPVAA